MRKSKKPKPSNAVESVERGNWEKIFGTLVQMMKNQEKQLQSFADQQNFLQDRLELQNQRWASDIKRYKDQISQVN